MSNGMKDLTYFVEDAQFILRNFSGREGQYNKEGDRNFGLIIPDREVAESLADDGWNIKWLEPLDEGEPETPWVSVAVSFKYKPPKAYFLTEDMEKGDRITEDIIGTLDYADIHYADVFIRGSRWEVNGKIGVKAYLQTLFVKIVKDPLEEKYSSY